MSWSDTFWSEADRLLRGWVPAETDITYQCVPWALVLALLPTIVAHVVVYIHRLQWRRQHERTAAPGRRGEGGGRGEEEKAAEREHEETEQRWLGRSAQATETALASLGLFAAGVVALQVERVPPLEANTYAVTYTAYRALHTFWSLSHAYDWVSPATAATPLRRWLAGPACSAALAGLAAAQAMLMFYEAAARRDRFDLGARNIWFATF